MRLLLTTALVGLGLIGFATAGLADEISFTDWMHEGSDTVVPIFTVSDSTPGVFSFKIGIDKDDPDNVYEVASISGIYIDFGFTDAANPYSDGSPTSTDVSNASVAHAAFGTDDSKINGVTNLNEGDFNVIIGWKPFAPLDVTDASTDNDFLTFDLLVRGGLTLDDIVRVGVRWQAVQPGGGSDKEVSITTEVVPEPASIALLGLALGGLAFGRRRRRAN